MKPILICGYPRSGTSYLAVQLWKNFGKKILSEPLYINLLIELQQLKRGNEKVGNIAHPYFSKQERLALLLPYLENFGDKIFEIVRKYSPSILLNKHTFIYPYEMLVKYFEHFKGYHIKEVRLHLYLGDSFFKENWDIYFIIRHPIDVFMSILKVNKFGKGKFHKLWYLIKNLGRKVENFYINSLKTSFNIWWLIDSATELYYATGIGSPPKTFIEYFVYAWTVSNYIAVNSVPENHIIVYEKPKTYYRLPIKFYDPIRVKIYPKAREDLQYEFERAAKRLNLENEYNYLLKFFD